MKFEAAFSFENVSEGLRKTIGIAFESHFEMYLDQGPGRPPLRAHISKHFRTNFGNVSNPSTRSVFKPGPHPPTAGKAPQRNIGGSRRRWSRVSPAPSPRGDSSIAA
ncbi:hypothetical protein PGTUg99_006108 [Puccinia graminis f. sp. tritici]|uniref:Uncharacterized protein n=1 Tax=Puccinia graminis f. sp. tritici TaxID=56615 RepID=A0A5B0RZY0_PUCGR|nr:hypothetical protein PGTUg99_006108 [Puccinia graminis f. sp. tritici]